MAQKVLGALRPLSATKIGLDMITKNVKGEHPMTGKRDVRMTPRVHDALMDQLDRFKEKFAREPGPNDPVFFDPDSDIPIPLSEERLRADFLAAAKDAGFSEERSLEIFAALFEWESIQKVNRSLRNHR